MLPVSTSLLSSSCSSSEKPASRSLDVVLIDFKAPLFSLQGDGGDVNTPSPSLTDAPYALFDTHFPQFRKRGIGWRLSVEEVYYLLWLSQHAPGSCTEPCHAVGADLKVTIAFATAELELMYQRLAAANQLACAAYVHLTTTQHMRLRHGGSLYGALFIGYDAGTRAHGEHLFFAGPLEPLAATRACRVASSVGKRACEVWLDAEAADDGLGAVRLRALVSRPPASSRTLATSTAADETEAPQNKKRRHV